MLIKNFNELETEINSIKGGNFSVNTLPKKRIGQFPLQDFQQYSISANENTIFISTIILNEADSFTNPIIAIKNKQKEDISTEVFDIPLEDRDSFDDDFECTKERLIKALNWIKNN